MADICDYAIVGGGIFAASVASAMRKWSPTSQIKVFKGTHKVTASHDKDKIVRSTYPEKDYREWAEECVRGWEDDKHYNGVGWLRVLNNHSPGYLKGAKDKVNTLGEVKARLHLTEDPKLEPNEEFWFNPDAGYINCAEAVDALFQDAKVEPYECNVTKLIVEDNTCLGVQVQGVDGKDIIHTARETVLAAGPWTLGILDRSNVLYRHEFFSIYGVGVATMPLTTDQDIALGTMMPILVTDGGRSGQLKNSGTLAHVCR